MNRFVLIVFILQCQHTLCTGQLSQAETRRNYTECAYNSFSLDCGIDLIVIESVLFAYRADCDSICCAFDSTDCFISPTDVTDYKRICSGKNSCNMDLSGSLEFCAFGPKDPSYVTAYYYCIPQTQIASVCSSTALSSNGRPLYVTSDNYPGVATGDATCSCSVEVYDCSANINIYILDADMYLDTTTCEQGIHITDGTNTTLKEVKCESYYSSFIQQDTLSTHYLKINFLDQSTQNQEGYFFLGVSASDSNATFSLSCTSATESWCVDCGALPTISFGRLQLLDGSNSGYEAEAEVVCDRGFEAEKSTVKCLANANWETSAVCTVKDCGTTFAISFGSAALDDVSNTTYGATATVNCDHGYKTTKETITCAETGTWDTTECEPVDCGTTFAISFGSAALDDVSNTTYGATATVNCDHGYKTTKETITCAETGTWDTTECEPVETNGTDGADNKENTDESKEKDGGLAPGIIAAIVVLLILLVMVVVVVVVVIIYKKFSKSQVEVANNEPLQKQTGDSEVSQPRPVSGAGSRSFVKRKPLPEITKQHKISHGHVYIDHGEAHVFGLTIHLPFGNKPANRLPPITRDEKN